jgi:sialate O-acetylesterase
LREQQLKTLSVPNTRMAVTMDIGDKNNINPVNKPEVGKRLALLALAKTYNTKIVAFSDLVYKVMKI